MKRKEKECKLINKQRIEIGKSHQRKNINYQPERQQRKSEERYQRENEQVHNW